MAKAIPFIRTSQNSWDVVNYPQIDPHQNIPVISCIGTARDGKSTLLNLYHNWYQQQMNKININVIKYNGTL